MPSAARVLKRHEDRIAYDAALASRHALDPKPCLCGDCRHWGDDSAKLLRPCLVRGSFRAPGGLFTEAGFGCVHGAKS